MSDTLPVIRKLQFSKALTVKYAMKGTVCRSAIFLGVGQSGKNLVAIAKFVPEGIAVIEAFPYHRMPYRAMQAMSEEIAARILDDLADDPIHVLAESQAAPMTVGALSHLPKCAKSITLIAPLGFNKSALGLTPDERYQTLMYRSRLFWRHPNQSLKHRANRDTLWEITKRSLPAFYRIKPDYTFGADQDIIEITKELARKIPVRIYADRNDSLFPYQEIKLNIRGSRIKLIESKAGSHINRATQTGLRELETIIASLPGSTR